MAKDINNRAFDETTLLKLSIFADCFSEWFPVFLFSPYFQKLFIFDFFAGSGKDINNNYGSPLELLLKAKGTERCFCAKANKAVHFTFNEGFINKSKELKDNVDEFLKECASNNNCESCKYTAQVINSNFRDLFTSEKVVSVLSNKHYGKFILLDQYGFKEIDENIFGKLISYPSTDFIFFITSSFIKRFKEHEYTKRYIDTNKIDFDSLRPDQCHRAIAEYYRQLIPDDKEYYLHHFSIQKENKGNYYGLIFGSNHTLGMEKFLKVCWDKDKLSGEANYDIDLNDLPGTLFHNENSNNKKEKVEAELRKSLLNGEITDNITGLKKAMALGCLPKIFIKVLKEEEEKNMTVRQVGTDLNYAASNIHNINEYKIERINHGT